MTQDYLRRQDAITAIAGATLSILDLASGEFVETISVPVGTYTVGALVRACRRGQVLVPDKGVRVLPASRGGYLQHSDGHFESAANPVFRVTNAMRQARQIELKLRSLEVAEKRNSAALRALERAGQPAIPVGPGDTVAREPASDPASGEVSNEASE